MYKQELNEKILDEILKYAAEKSIEEMADKFPTDEELEKEVIFRPEFKDRMSKFFTHIKRRERTRLFGRTMLKVGACTVAVLIVFSTVVFSVDAVRVSFLNIFSVKDDESTTIHVDDGTANYDAFSDKIHGIYLPSYIPASYSVQDVEKYDTYYYVIFANADGDKIKLQNLLGDSSSGVDNEGATVETITVNNENAQYFSKDGENILIFKYNKNVFKLTTSLSKDELIKMAESMEYRQ